MGNEDIDRGNIKLRAEKRQPVLLNLPLRLIPKTLNEKEKAVIEAKDDAKQNSVQHLEDVDILRSELRRIVDLWSDPASE